LASWSVKDFDVLAFDTSRILSATMPKLGGIIESGLYVENLQRAALFYEQVLGLRQIAGDERFVVYSVAERDVLLLFKRGGTTEPLHVPGGMLPPHDGSGQNHMAFAVTADELDSWEERLAAHQIGIESRVDWPRGGSSLYFRDPDGNLLELATPGIWSIY
jgi:catechol 2,3-dioxygenase-like lactoylglutathione lyase family enzyme